MDALGWDSCDIVLVTGDAYIDHPSFGMAIIGRLLEAQGFRVGIIAQPDWQNAGRLQGAGQRRTLFFGVTGGNMDSMVNRYTSDRRIRHNDSYTPDGEGGKRPDRAVIVYSQRCREAYKDVPIVLGGIESSLRRIAHYDYWSDKVRRSILVDAKADHSALRQCRARARRGGHPLAEGRDRNAPRSTIRGVALRSNRRARGLHGATTPTTSTAPTRARAQGRAKKPSSACRPSSRWRPTGGLRPRLARAASREQSRQCAPAGAAPRRPRTVADAAAHPADDRRKWTRSTSLPYARAPHPVLWRGQDPRLGHDPLFGDHHARLFRRLHLLLDHRARRPHHPEPFGRTRSCKEIEKIRDKTRGLHRHHLGHRRPDRQHVPDRLQGPGRSRTPAASRPASIPTSAPTSTPATRR
jgi:hypothetical protein